MFEDIFHNLGDAVLFADREGVIRLWNANCELIFGWTAEEAVGKSLDLIVPERSQPRHWEGFKGAIARGDTKYAPGELLSVPAMHKNGERISIEFTVGMLKDASGAATGIAACVRDVSARRKEEQALRARLAELEPKPAE